jgi:hypothetical protein
MSNEKLVTVPFSDKIITEHFQSEEEKVFLVDYKKSSLKDEKMMTYLSNTEIAVNLSVHEDLSYEEKEKLMIAWMKSKNLIPIDTLTIAWLDIIMRYKHRKAYFPSFMYGPEKDKFIERNQDFLNELVEFLDSIFFHNLVSLEFDKKENATKIIDDPHAVPINVMNLFAIDLFYEYFIVKDPSHKTWYVHQFEKQPDIISHYYANPNPLTAICNITKRKQNEKIQRDS